MLGRWLYVPKTALKAITCDDRSRPRPCIVTDQVLSFDKVTVKRVGSNSFMREAIDPARPTAY